LSIIFIFKYESEWLDKITKLKKQRKKILCFRGIFYRRNKKKKKRTLGTAFLE